MEYETRKWDLAWFVKLPVSLDRLSILLITIFRRLYVRLQFYKAVAA